MPCKLSPFLCFTSTQKHSTWNTNWIRSEQYWCGGYSGRCWRSKFERRIGILQTVFGRYGNGEWKAQFSTLPCLPSTCLCSTINWIMYSWKWKMLQKSTSHLDSFWKILRLECVDTFTFTRSMQLWKELNLCVHKLIWLTSKTECKNWMLLIFVPDKKTNTKRKFYKLTNLTFFASLLKDVPMGCKETVLPGPLLKNHNVNCLTFERNTRQP